MKWSFVNVALCVVASYIVYETHLQLEVDLCIEVSLCVCSCRIYLSATSVNS